MRSKVKHRTKGHLNYTLGKPCLEGKLELAILG